MSVIQACNRSDVSAFLWDQYTNGEQIVLGCVQYRKPVFKIGSQVLNAAYRVHLEGKSKPCVFVKFKYEPVVDGVLIIGDSATDPLLADRQKFHCQFIRNDSIEDSTDNQFVELVCAAYNSWLSKLEESPMLSRCVSGRLVGKMKGPACQLHIDLICLERRIRAMPICKLPLNDESNTLNALRSASSGLRSTLEYGFILIQHKNLVNIVFKHERNLCNDYHGIWISGVSNLHHPFVWLVLAQWLSEPSQRNCGIFLVLIFPCNSDEILFYNCVSADKFMKPLLFRGALNTSISRVPCAANKFLTVSFEQIILGPLHDEFTDALRISPNYVHSLSVPNESVRGANGQTRATGLSELDKDDKCKKLQSREHSKVSDSATSCSDLEHYLKRNSGQQTVSNHSGASVDAGTSCSDLARYCRKEPNSSTPLQGRDMTLSMGDDMFMLGASASCFNPVNQFNSAYYDRMKENIGQALRRNEARGIIDSFKTHRGDFAPHHPDLPSDPNASFALDHLPRLQYDHRLLAVGKPHREFVRPIQGVPNVVSSFAVNTIAMKYVKDRDGCGETVMWAAHRVEPVTPFMPCSSPGGGHCNCCKCVKRVPNHDSTPVGYLRGDQRQRAHGGMLLRNVLENQAARIDGRLYRDS